MVENEKYVRRNKVKRENETKVFQYCLVFICGMLIAGSKINEIPVCFGVAFVGATGAGVCGLLSLLGVCTGYIFFWGFQLSGGYIASAFFVYTIAFVFQYTALSERVEFMPSVVTIVTGITLMYGSVSINRVEETVVFRLIFELIASYFSTLIFRSIVISDNPAVDDEILSFIVFVSCVITTFSDYYIMDLLSVGEIVANVCLLVISYTLPSSKVCVPATIMGVFLDLSGGTFFHLFTNAIYSVSLNVIKIKNKIINIVILCFAVIFISVYSDEFQMRQAIFEVLVSGCVFMFIPKRVFEAFVLYLMFPYEEEQPYEEMDYDLLEELFYDLQLCLQDSLKTNQDYSLQSVCFAGFEELCSSCNRKDICRSNHGEKVYDLICKLGTRIEEQGTVTEKDFPLWFVDYCDMHNEIREEILRRLKNQYKDKILLEEKNNQYILLCDLFQIITSSTLKVMSKLPRYRRCYLKIEAILRDYLFEQGYSAELCVKEFADGRKCIELTGGDTKSVVKDKKCLERISKMMDSKLRVLKDSHNANSILLVESEPYSISVGVASKKKRGERVCGDQCSYFKTTDGVFYAILSDGLGTGEYAATQSRKMIERLERFIICGISPEEALRMVYTIFELNNMDSLSCATVDLLSVNLYSGEAVLLKLGSPASYCVSDDEVRVYKGDKLPAGLMMNYTKEVEAHKIQLQPKDVFVLLTDGVFICESSDFVNMIHEEIGMKNLARRILIDSQKTTCLDDDMTVITIKMDHRK